MSDLTPVHSRENPRFKALCRLADSARERRKEGLTLLDGLHLITAYEAVHGPVINLVVSEAGLQQGEIATFLAGRLALRVSNGLFRELTAVETPSGILGVIPLPEAASQINPGADLLVLDGVQDPGNVGTLLRTAAAAGLRQVLLSSDCAGAWSPKVLRAGQGAHFLLQVVESADPLASLADYRGTVAATALDGATSLYAEALAAPMAGPLAWVFGSEGQGVRAPLMARAGLRVKIPMPGAVESLNVAAAAAICLFEMVRRRG